MLPGCAIFDAIRRAVAGAVRVVADRGLRDGMLLRMMRDRSPTTHHFSGSDDGYPVPRCLSRRNAGFLLMAKRSGSGPGGSGPSAPGRGPSATGRTPSAPGRTPSVPGRAPGKTGANRPGAATNQGDAATAQTSRTKAVSLRTARGRTTAQQRWLSRQLNDPYVVAARKQGWRSRAAFKLIELDDKLQLIRHAACGWSISVRHPAAGRRSR